MINKLKAKPGTELKKYFEMNESEYRTYQNLWSAAKAVLQEKFISANAH